MWQRAVIDLAVDWLITQTAFQQLVFLQPFIGIHFHSKSEGFYFWESVLEKFIMDMFVCY